MRYLVIVMMVPLLLGGCLESIVLNTAKSAAYNTASMFIPKGKSDDEPKSPFCEWCSYLTIRSCMGSVSFGPCRSAASTSPPMPKDCTPENPQGCFKEWKELSDADFCKRYSPINELVALELKRRKLDCSKLDDSASSK